MHSQLRSKKMERGAGDPARSSHRDDEAPPAKRRQTQTTQITLSSLWKPSTTGSQATPQQSLPPACLSRATTTAAATATAAEVSPVTLGAPPPGPTTSTVAAAAAGRVAAARSAIRSTTTSYPRIGACENNRLMESFPPTGPVVVPPASALEAQMAYLVRKTEQGCLPCWVIITAGGMACATCRSVAGVITRQGLNVNSKTPWVNGEFYTHTCAHSC